jgi:hypothetical protein
MKYMGHQIEGINAIYGNPVVEEWESKLINSVTFDGIDFGKYQIATTLIDKV